MLISLIFLAACAAYQTAGWDMENSKEQYKDCLIKNPNDVSKCETLKKLYEIDKEAVHAISGTRPKEVILMNP